MTRVMPGVDPIWEGQVGQFFIYLTTKYSVLYTRKELEGILTASGEQAYCDVAKKCTHLNDKCCRMDISFHTHIDATSHKDYRQ